MHKLFIVHWQGPYDLIPRGVKAETPKIFFNGGLYIVTGIEKYKRTNSFQYVGKAKDTPINSYFERHKRHSIYDKITRKQRVWLGNIVFPDHYTNNDLEEVEGMLIYCYDPPQNSSKTKKVPKQATIINKWFKRNDEDWSTEPYINKPKIISEVDDVVSWDGKDWWTSARLKIYENE